MTKNKIPPHADSPRDKKNPAAINFIKEIFPLLNLNPETKRYIAINAKKSPKGSDLNQPINPRVNIGREIQAEMIANGRPSPAKLRNAMSNPHTWNALKQIGLIPKKTKILEGNVNPQLKIELTGVEDEVI